MWWMLLASVLDDAETDAGRRAASHELARRMGVGWRPVQGEAPPSPLSLRELVLQRIEMARTVEDAVALALASGHLMGAFDGEHTVFPHVDFGPFGADWPSRVTHPQVPFVGATSDLTPIFSWFVDVYAERVRRWFAFEPNHQERIRVYLGVVAELSQHMRELLDWARTRPLEEVRAMSPADAIEAAGRWHQAMRRAKNGPVGMPKRGTVVARFSDGATIERLWSRAQLESEGKAMGHCVGTHHASVTDGNSAVFSYRDATGMPHATWEVTAPYRPFGLSVEILDLEGPENEAVTTEIAQNRVSNWIEASGVEIGHYAAKVGEREGIRHRLVPAALVSPTGLSAVATPTMRTIDAAQEVKAGGYIEVARKRDAEMMEAVRDGQSAQALSDLHLLANALDLRYDGLPSRSTTPEPRRRAGFASSHGRARLRATWRRRRDD